MWQWIWQVRREITGFMVSEIFEKENIRNFLYYNNTTAVKWHLWFLPALLYCYVLFWAAEKLHAQKLAEFFIPVLLLGHFMMEEASVLTGKEYRVMEFRNYLYTGFPFFMAGFWIHKHQEILKKHLKGRAIYLGIIMGSFLNRRIFPFGADGAFYRFRYSDLQSVFLRNYKRRRKSAVISLKSVLNIPFLFIFFIWQYQT